MIDYANHAFSNHAELEELDVEQKPRKQDYSRSRSYKPRRRPKRQASHPGLGIAGRSNRRRTA